MVSHHELSKSSPSIKLSVLNDIRQFGIKIMKRINFHTYAFVIEESFQFPCSWESARLENKYFVEGIANICQNIVSTQKR